MQKNIKCQGTSTHLYPGTWETKVSKFLWVQGQHGLCSNGHSKTLPQKSKTQEKRKICFCRERMVVTMGFLTLFHFYVKFQVPTWCPLLPPVGTEHTGFRTYMQVKHLYPYNKSKQIFFKNRETKSYNKIILISHKRFSLSSF